jgi:hypothetical protein
MGLAATILCAAGVLAVATPSAPAEVIGPVLVLGPTTIVNGTAYVSGTVGEPNSNLDLTINGRPVGLNVGGTFAAAIDLAGTSSLTFGLRNPTTGRTETTTIPLNTNIIGPGGLIGPGVLDSLERAAVELLEPVGGFRITDGLPIRVEGNVGDPTELASLKVNGQDVLSALSGDGGFSVAVPGTTKEITIMATDRQGVSHLVTMPVVHGSSPGTGAAAPTVTTVSASAAVGVRIAKVRYITRTVRRTKRMRMIVTVKDRRGLLVRNATVKTWSRFTRRIVRNPRIKRTNKAGQVAFLLRTTKRAFGKRLVMVTIAKTPTAVARKTTAVRLPRLKRTTARR